MKFIRKSQSATEYAIFIAAVLIALLAMQVYYSRAVKGKVKSNADSIGEQFNTKDGSYLLNTTSVSSRTINRGSGLTSTGGSMVTSNSVIAKDFDTELANNLGGDSEGDGKLKTINYAGGEVSSTKYDGDGTYDMGAITTKGHNVFKDGNVTEKKKE